MVLWDSWLRGESP